MTVLKVYKSFKAMKHQAEIKELVPNKADCVVALCHLHLGQNVAIEHTGKTTAIIQLVCTFCACVR